MPALDYRDNRKAFQSGDREFISGRGNDLIAIDYPTLALFTDKYSFLKDRFPGIFETRFSEWMLDGGVGFESINNKNRWAELTLTNVRDQLIQGKFGIFSPAFKRFEPRQEGQDKDFSITGNGDGFSVTLSQCL